MAKLISINTFSGMQAQPNSFNVAQGSLDRAENVMLASDNIISKAGGNYDYLKISQQEIVAFFNYKTSLLIATKTKLIYVTPKSLGKLETLIGSSSISLLTDAVLNADQFITQLRITDSEFWSHFTLRHAVAQETVQVTKTISGTAQLNSNSAEINNPGYTVELDQLVTVISSTGNIIPPGTYPISAVIPGNFQIYVSTGSMSLVSLTYSIAGRYFFSSYESAPGTFTSTANSASFQSYLEFKGVTFSGTTSTPRSINASNNLYITSDNGLVKVEHVSLPLLKAGIMPGLDLTIETKNNTGIFTPNSQIAYRVLFGRKDANTNVVLGAPSPVEIAVNRLSAVTIISMGGNIATCTSTAHGLITGDSMYLYSVAPTSVGIPDATVAVVTKINDNQFSFDVSSITPTPGAITSLSYGVAKTPVITFTVPDEISTSTTPSDYFYRIYRTPLSVNEETIPQALFKLVDETNIPNGASYLPPFNYLKYTDNSAESIVAQNPELYTNSTQEGEAQAANRPPKSGDLQEYKGYVFYSCLTDYCALTVSLIAPGLLPTNWVTIGTQRYVFVGDNNNEAVGNENTTSTTISIVSNKARVTINNHGFNSGDYISVNSAVGTGLSLPSKTEFTVTRISASQFDIDRTQSPSATITSIEVEGIKTSAGYRIVKAYKANGNTTVSESIDYTARLLVNAINRNKDDLVFAQYVSAVDATPGKIYLEAKKVTSTFTFTPINGFSIDGAQEGEQNIALNQISISKYLEPEATPILQRVDVGSKASKILRICALRDSLIVIKEDGIYRLNGDNPNNFSVTILDSTVICVASNSVVVLNNSVYMLSNQGVVQITDNGVKIISRPIEPLISAGVNSLTESLAAGIALESDRLYLLSMQKPNTTTSRNDLVYVYNYLTDGWTTLNNEDYVFSCGVLSASGKQVHSLAVDKSRAKIARKENNKTDYSLQSYPCRIFPGEIAQVEYYLTADITITTKREHGLQIGDIITLSNAGLDFETATDYFLMGGGSLVTNYPKYYSLVPVTQVLNTTKFVATLNTAPTAAGVDFIMYKKGIRNIAAEITIVAGNREALVTRNPLHYQTTNQFINIEYAESTVLAAITTADDLIGYKSVTKITDSTFSIILTRPSVGNVTGVIEYSSEIFDGDYVSLGSYDQVRTQPGDGIIVNNKIYKIDEITSYDNTYQLLKLQNVYPYGSKEFTYIYDICNSVVKFMPLTCGSVVQLKLFNEFHSHFRNDSSCSRLKATFACDSASSSPPVYWRSNLGGATNVAFNAYGKTPFGLSPYGGVGSINKDFRPGAAVILRTYMPIDTFSATFVQPVLEHRVVGEPLEIQAIGLYYTAANERTSI